MELESDKYDTTWTRYYDRSLAKITKAKDILPQNKETILDFIKFLNAIGKKPRTVARYVYTYQKLLQAMPSKKIVVVKATKEQLIDCVNNIDKLDGVGEATKAKIRICLKVIYTYFNGEVDKRDGKTLFTPKEVAFVRTEVKKGSKERLTYSDLLTDKEIDRLLDNTMNPRDFFLISLMADAPLRTHEILRLQRKHLSLDNPAYLQIPNDTKTGARRVPLVNSIPAARQYLETRKDLQPDEPLFMYENWSRDKKPLTGPGLHQMLHKVAKRAGVDPKRVYPYAFRHRWCSMMASKLSNATLENVAGWKAGTNMHEVYQHMNPGQDDIEVRKAYGIAPKEKEENQLKAKIVNCKVCKGPNSNAARFCSTCGRALSQEVAIQQEELKKTAITAALDTDYITQLVKAAVEERMKAKPKK